METKQELPNVKKGKKGLIITLLVILLMAATGYGIIYYLQYKNESDLWISVQQDGTISGYERFVQRYPDNRYAIDAKKILVEMQEKDETAWQKVKQDPNRLTLSQYLNQMTKYGGRHVEEATAMLDNLEWEAIQNSRDPQLIRAYMARFPGKHPEEVAILLDQCIKNIAKGKIADFMSKYSNEDISALMNYFDEYTSSYMGRTDVSRFEIYDDLKATFIEEGNTIYQPDFMQLEVREDSRGDLITSFPATPLNAFAPDPYDENGDSSNVVQPLRFSVNFTPAGKIKLLEINQ